MRHRVLLARLLVFSLIVAPVAAQPSAKPPPVMPATVKALDGIFAGFKDRPLVGIGDAHGLAQEQEFYAAIIRDPRFASDVGNLVVEFGGAAQQKTLDRFINGENVSYPELRRVWTDVVGWVPTVTYQGFVNIYATVREVNMKLPKDRRIKVWLGEPAIDWTKVRTAKDWQPLNAQRDRHPAQLVEREILAKGKKAMLIYGTWHLGIDPTNLRQLVQQKNPKAFFIVMPYPGFHEQACADRFEKTLNWAVPSLIAPFVSTPAAGRILQPGCNVFDPADWAGDDPAQAAREIAAGNRNNLGLDADAMLYLGPKKTLVRSPTMLDMYLDLDFRREMDRRYRIIAKKPLGDVNGVERNPVINQPYLP